jgi:gliding motility-associated-like protein
LFLGTNTTYYAEGYNNGCTSTIRKPITITAYKLPDVMDEEVVLCKLGTVDLDAKIAGMTYLWSNNGETDQTITVSNPGTYSVQVTSPPENCSKIKTITVVENEIPEIDRIDVNEQTVAIYLKKEETYFEYSIDGINYQVSNTFLNVPSGLQTAYVRDIYNCSVSSDTFIVLIAPKFFTPNNDGPNDSWGIEGMVHYPQAQIMIFDRYGKFLSELNNSKLTWDGMLNKTPLPADDYWYVLKIDNTKLEKRGHFSLKR